MDEDHMDNLRIEVVGDKKTQFTSLLHELQLIVNKTIDIVVSKYGKKPIGASNWVAIIILKRIIESTKASEVLICNEFDRDAAVLLTNQIELRLDLQYISKEHAQAKKWLNHESSYRKPWRVSELLKKIFENKYEFDTEKEMYKRFSMVKHGNPVAETFAFPLAIKNGWLTVPPKEDILLGKFALYIYANFGELFRAYKAATSDFKRCKFDLEKEEDKANFINTMMHDLYTQNINEQSHLLEKIAPKPELCNSCVVVPENTIEITCLLRRKKSSKRFSCEKYKSN